MAVLNPPIAISARNDHNYDDFMQAIAAGFAGTSTMRPAPGILPSWGSELAVTAGTGLQVVVGPGVVMIPTPDPGRGGWLVTNNASITISLAAAHPSNGRIDRVIARVSDVQYHSGADNLAAIEVITGTPSPSPAVPPVPTGKGSYVELRRITVAPGAGSLAGAIALPPAGLPYTGSVGRKSITWTGSIFLPLIGREMFTTDNLGCYTVANGWVSGSSVLTCTDVLGSPTLARFRLPGYTDAAANPFAATNLNVGTFTYFPTGGAPAVTGDLILMPDSYNEPRGVKVDGTDFTPTVSVGDIFTYRVSYPLA